MNTTKMIGTYRLECRDKFGKLRWSVLKKNIVTAVGKAQISLMTGASGTPFTYIALGTSATTPTVSDTALNAEISTNGLGRAAGTVSQITTTTTNDTYQITHVWTATGTSTINEVGVFNAASVGTMLSHALTGAKTVNNTDTLTGTYDLQFI